MKGLTDLDAIMLEYEASERGEADRNEFGMKAAFAWFNSQLERDFPDDETARYYAQDNGTEMFQWGFRIGFLCGNREMVRRLTLGTSEQGKAG